MITLWLWAPDGRSSRSTWRTARIEIGQSAFDGSIKASPVGAGRAIESLLVAEIEQCAPHEYLVRHCDDRKKGCARIFVNGRELGMGGRAIAHEGDRIRLDDWILRIGHVRLPVQTSELEARLLAEVQERPKDDELREVYADYLEENGRLPNAELLRVQSRVDRASPDDPTLPSLTTQLRAAAKDVDDAWRSLVARPSIEMCGLFDDDEERLEVRLDVECPKRWDELARETASGNANGNESDKVRHCHACDKPVTYCTSVEDAARIARLGGCVALDPALTRREGDVQRPSKALPPPGRWSGRMGQVVLYQTKV